MKTKNGKFIVEVIIAVFVVLAIIALFNIASAGYQFGKWLEDFLH